MLLDGGFPRRLHGVIPCPKTKKKQLAGWCAKYNDGHQFLRGRGGHSFIQLYTWAVYWDVSAKLGLNREERIQRPAVHKQEEHEVSLVLGAIS